MGLVRPAKIYAAERWPVEDTNAPADAMSADAIPAQVSGFMKVKFLFPFSKLRLPEMVYFVCVCVSVCVSV